MFLYVSCIMATLFYTSVLCHFAMYVFMKANHVRIRFTCINWLPFCGEVASEMIQALQTAFRFLLFHVLCVFLWKKVVVEVVNYR